MPRFDIALSNFTIYKEVCIWVSSYLKVMNKTITHFNRNYFSHRCETHHNNHPKSYHKPTLTFECLPLTGAFGVFVLLFWFGFVFVCFLSVCLFSYLFIKKGKNGALAYPPWFRLGLYASAVDVNPMLTPRAYVCVTLSMGSCSKRPRRVPVSHHGILKRIPFPYTGKRKEGNGDYD